MTGRNTKMGSFKKGEDAVSPVIGVILMVAITVILAAVIGAFVFGMGSNVQKTYTIGVTAAQTSATTIDLTFQGGPDADAVESINVSVDGAPFGCAIANSGAATYDETANPTLGLLTGGTVSVGQTVTLTDTGNAVISDKRDHVIVTAKFSDGSQQVVLDTYV
jgi:flagellin-like protein